MNVLVVSSKPGLFFGLLRSILSPNYAVQTISLDALASQTWASTCALLVMPSASGSDLAPAVPAINTYIRHGGSLLAVGASAAMTKPDDIGVVRLSDISLTFPLPVHSRCVGIKLAAGDQLDDVTDSINNDGLDAIEHAVGIEILAMYTQPSPSMKIAAVRYNRAIIWGPHIDNELTPAASANTALRKSLLVLGLQLPSSETPQKEPLLPQFLVCSKAHPHAVGRVLDALGGGLRTFDFEDTSDTFRFHTLQDAACVLKLTSSDVKHVIACERGELPAAHMTNLFNLEQYFHYLAEARTLIKENDDGRWGFGEVLFYGEVVTSTQTMLDKNPQLFKQLPMPVVSLASYQLAGRGRGTNVWEAPRDGSSLSFSLAFRPTGMPEHHFIFIQYLFMLAVVEACRDERVLGPAVGERVRIKWPNDLYVVGLDGKGGRKAGGVLVSLMNDDSKGLVIGCGLNLNTHEPLISLASLISYRHLSPERTMAVILETFECMWARFVEGRGSFVPFEQLYLARWLHSGEEVTVTSTYPHVKVRVLGITQDYGYLHTVSVDGGESIDLKPDGNSYDMMAGLIRAKT